MSEAIAFDSHRFVRRLTDGGFTVKQAETLAEEQVALLNANLATKADIARIETGTERRRQETKTDIARIETNIERLRQETKTDIARIETNIERLRQETKTDIARVETNIERLRQETKTEVAKVETRMEAIKSDLMKWLIGAMIAQGGLVVSLIKLL